MSWIAVGTTAVNVGASVYGASQAGKGGSQGPQVVTGPQYSFTEPRLRLTSDFISDNLQRLQAGKYPAYYEGALPGIKKGLKRDLRTTFFGGQGLGEGQGIVGEARSTGAVTGIGPKATVAQVNKALSTYATKEQEIDEYLTKIGVDFSAQTQGQVLAASGQLPGGPGSTTLPGSSAPPGPNYGLEAANALGQAAPYFFNNDGTDVVAGGTVPGRADTTRYTGDYTSGGAPTSYSNLPQYNVPPGGGSYLQAPTSSTIHPTNLSQYYL